MMNPPEEDESASGELERELEPQKPGATGGPWDPFSYFRKTISPTQRLELLRLEVPVLPPEDFMDTADLKRVRFARLRRWRPALLGLGVLIIALLFAGFWFWHSSSAPAVDVVTPPPVMPRAQPTPPAPPRNEARPSPSAPNAPSAVGAAATSAVATSHAPEAPKATLAVPPTPVRPSESAVRPSPAAARAPVSPGRRPGGEQPSSATERPILPQPDNSSATPHAPDFQTPW